MEGLGIGLLAVVAAGAIYFISGLRKVEARGPLPEGALRPLLFRSLWWSHGITAAAAVNAGLILVAPVLMYVDAIPAIVVGAPVGYFWSRARMQRAEIRRAGPDPSTPPERLFPSDRAAMSMHEGFAHPLPIWIDLLMLAACVGAGSVIGVCFWRLASYMS